MKEWISVVALCFTCSVMAVGLKDASIAIEGKEFKFTKPAVQEVVSLDGPGVGESYYAVKGEICYTDVLGKSYLEMWSFFPGGGRYFTRTLGESGPMKYLKGSSDWRPFILPFDASSSDLNPEKLTVSMVLKGGGIVQLRKLKLVQGTSMEEVFGTSIMENGTSRTNRIWSWIGGAIGCLGAVIGIMASWRRSSSLRREEELRRMEAIDK